MSVDALFRQVEAEGYRFPEMGQRVRVRSRLNGRWRVGTVTLLWAAMEPVITVTEDDGRTLQVYVTLGDQWEAADPAPSPEER